MDFEVVLNDDINSKLIAYQKPHVKQIVKSLISNRTAFDASDTGTGKTYTSTAACKQLGYRPFIVCPKAVVRSWQRVLKLFNCEYYGISNYELIQSLKYYPPQEETSDKMAFDNTDTKMVCDWIQRVTTPNPAKASGVDTSFKWLLPHDAIFIFDEAHKCRNHETINAQLILGAKHSTHLNPILILSATLADKPKHFGIFGYLFDFSKDPHRHSWLKKMAAKNNTNEFETLNKLLFPKYGARMSIKVLGDQFPQNQVMANCYNMENAQAIQREYDSIRIEIENIKRKLHSSDALLVLMLRARQRIELLKVPTIVEMAVNHLEEGKSVVIFVCFTKTLETICQQLRTDCYIVGGQSLVDREREIKRFQNDESRVIVVNIQAGGVGISLHDLNGNFPRVSLISPSWSATDIIQALGRIHRAGAKTPARQEIIFTAGTIEEVVCDRIGGKIQNIASLNDGDLDAYFIGGIHDKPIGAPQNPMQSLHTQAGLQEVDTAFGKTYINDALPTDANNTMDEPTNKKGLDARIQAILREGRTLDVNNTTDESTDTSTSTDEFDPMLPDKDEIHMDAIKVSHSSLSSSIIRSSRYKKVIQKEPVNVDEKEKIKQLAELAQKRIEIDNQVLKLETEMIELLKQFDRK